MLAARTNFRKGNKFCYFSTFGKLGISNTCLLYFLLFSLLLRSELQLSQWVFSKSSVWLGFLTINRILPLWLFWLLGFLSDFSLRFFFVLKRSLEGGKLIFLLFMFKRRLSYAFSFSKISTLAIKLLTAWIKSHSV